MKQKQEQTGQVDKLQFTLHFQLMRATEDLLAEALEEGYAGYVEIVAKLIDKSKGECVLDVSLNKLGTTRPNARIDQKSGTPNAVFHLVPGKGAKRIVN